MRTLVTILAIFISADLSAQDCEFMGVNKKARYRYEYWLRLRSSLDSISIVPADGSEYESGVILTVRDAERNLIPYIPVKLVRQKDDSTFTATTDFEGVAEFRVSPGEYLIEIKQVYFTDFVFIYTLESGKKYVFYPRLAPFGVYQINAKRKLSQPEIEAISSCLMTSGTIGCSQRDLFEISMQL